MSGAFRRRWHTACGTVRHPAAAPIRQQGLTMNDMQFHVPRYMQPHSPHHAANRFGRFATAGLITLAAACLALPQAAAAGDRDEGEGRAARDERSVVRRHSRDDAARRGPARGHGARRAAAHARRRRDEAGGRREERARQADGAAEITGPLAGGQSCNARWRRSASRRP